MMYPTQNSLLPIDFPATATEPQMLERLLQPRLMLFWGAETPTRTLLTAITAMAAKGQASMAISSPDWHAGSASARMGTMEPRSIPTPC
jgi:hypothetical protein